MPLPHPVQHCPYCESVRSLLMGDVFCSRHAGSDMRKLENGTLLIRTPHLEETAEHISRLSIRLMLNGEQWYKVGQADKLVHAGNFLVIDQGQRYRTAFHGDHELEMIMVGFRPGLAEDVHRTLTTEERTLLDEPFCEGPELRFFEQVYPEDPVVASIFLRLRRLMDAPLADRKAADLDHLHSTLLERLVRLQFQEARRTDRLRLLTRSARLEGWRRVSVARDLMEAAFMGPLQVNDLARAACLSPHHFKRLFRDAYGTTPHRYLTDVRLRRAHELLRSGQHTVADVCHRVGFLDLSSFGRLYRQTFGHPPGATRTLGKALPAHRSPTVQRNFA